MKRLKRQTSTSKGFSKRMTDKEFVSRFVRNLVPEIPVQLFAYLISKVLCIK